MTTANRALSAQLALVESTCTSEQRDASTRLSEDLRLRSELAADLARENRLEARITSCKGPHFDGGPYISERISKCYQQVN